MTNEAPGTTRTRSADHELLTTITAAHAATRSLSAITARYGLPKQQTDLTRSADAEELRLIAEAILKLRDVVRPRP